MSKRKTHKRRQKRQNNILGSTKGLTDIFGMVAVGSVAVAGISSMTGALKK